MKELNLCFLYVIQTREVNVGSQIDFSLTKWVPEMYVLFRFRFGFSTVKRSIIFSRINEIENVFVMYFPNTCHIYMSHMCPIYIFVTYMARISAPYNVFAKHMPHIRVSFKYLLLACPISVYHIMYFPIHVQYM